MIPVPAVDGRRVESFFQELRRFALNYTPDLNLSDEQSAGVALMRVFAQLAEIVAVRLDQAPQKHFVAFLDKLGITLLPARAARAAITFRLAAGLAQEVTVPSGTRVTAPGEEDEIPFETTGELVAIPGVLTAAYGVDPLKDLIFGPPLNFLKQEPRTPTELSYEVQSFVPANANRLQLNHTTELEPGAFIRIGCKEKKIVQKVEDGNFVTLFEPVKENFTEGAIVTPIRNFEVFNGIDRQEHILYIGHTNLFTVKEKVEITLEIELSNSEPSSLQPLNLVWEFWTKDEDVTPEQDEHWQRLDVKSDGTGGLSSTGRVVLVKPEKLEIKPREVGRRESRWIRARLEDKLPVGSVTLPEIETIKIAVSTQLDVNGKPIGIFADQGFYNATPLDVQVDADVGFFPFGTEPRQFDQFYVASKEAFSKREAAVALDFQLELQTLGSPSVVRTDIIGIRAYALGLRRRLYELVGGAFNILGNPVENEASSFLPLEDAVPSAITNDSGGIFVFVNTKDSQTPDNPANKIWVHFHNFNQTGTWTDLGAPGAGTATVRLPFSPAAVRTPSNAWAHFSRVFVVGADGKLYSRGHTGGAGWDDHGSPGVSLNSPPFAVAVGSQIFVFANGEGTVHWLRLRSDLTAEWKSLTPDNQVFTPTYRPFAHAYIDNNGDEQAKVFTFAFTDPNNKTTGRLFECDTRDEDLVTHEFPWNDLGQPTAREITEGAPEAHAPDGFVERPTRPVDEQGRHIFLRGADNKLYERSDALQWRDHSRSGDPDLRGSPAVFLDPPSGVPAGATTIKSYVFSASGRNSLVKWVFEDLRITVSDVSDAERLGVLLDQRRASRRDNDYTSPQQILEIISGPGNGEDEPIVAYDGSLALARLDGQLTTLPNNTSEIKIGGISVGFAQKNSDDILAIHAPVSDNFTAKPIYVRIDDGTINVFADFAFYSRITGMVSLDSFPNSPAIFAIHSELRQGGTEFNSPEDTGSVPELSWEYWNGRGWLSLRRISDSTHNLLKNGEVKFQVPKDIEATEVAGQENFWIRARLVGGDYGREVFRLDGTPPDQKIVSEKSSLRPPKVRTLLLSYQASPSFPEICLTFNNLDYLDQTAASETAGSHFPPFDTLEDNSYTIFFGFDKSFKTGPVRLLLDAAERNFDETNPPEFAWSFRKDRKWKSLDADDGSIALTRQGILTVSASEELTRESRFGKSLYWIKGSLRLDRALADFETEVVETTGPCGETKHEPEDPCAEPKSTDPKDEAECTCANKCSCQSTGPAEDPCAPSNNGKTSIAARASADYPQPLLRGIFLNTVWATHGETITEEIVGSGDGEPNQTHALQKADVLSGEDIRVQEALSAEERERIERELGKDSVVDREDLGGSWVRWKEVKALFDSGPHDRCYEIDRAAGILRFGDGVHGSIVPAGVDNIHAFSYRTGGGSVGNVDTNQIEGLATAVAGIESVFNPAPAGGGSDKADTDAMLTIGPRRISHGDRAVSVEDFEELAHEASRQVAKVRCLGTTNLVRAGAGPPDPCDPRQSHQALREHGRVSLVIVPHSPDPRPCPSLALRRAVKDYLSERAPSVIAAGDRIVVRPPDYVTVGIEAKIFVNTLEKAAAVETEARTRLEKFLHPVSGGPDGNGWEFGRPVTRSDIFALLERLPDVDRVEDLVFLFGSRRDANRVEIGPNELLASGEHKLAIKKA